MPANLNARKYEDAASLQAILNQHLETWEAIYGDEKKDRAPEERFAELITKAAETTGRNAVILIDEYDKPLLQAIGNKELQTDYRNTLKAFYGVLKSCDRYIRFALLTGVTKFSKVSIFSDLNNLRDISMDEAYTDICGITEKELYRVFEEDIRLLGEKNEMDESATRQMLKQWYDGYHFAQDCPDIYNPFSLLNTFATRRFGSYWFETGTPTILVEVLKRNRYDLHRLTEEQTTADVLGSIDSMEDNPVPLFYQSVSKSESIFQISLFAHDVENGDIDAFMQRLQSFFADIPYELARDLELHYQNVLFIVFKLLGFYTQVEYHTARGRIDLVLKTDTYIYVMEFKLDGTAKEALQQIEEKGYTTPFAADPRQLVKVGVNFNNALRGIEKWVVKQV